MTKSRRRYRLEQSIRIMYFETKIVQSLRVKRGPKSLYDPPISIEIKAYFQLE